jgi:hypothetical protein
MSAVSVDPLPPLKVLFTVPPPKETPPKEISKTFPFHPSPH